MNSEINTYKEFYMCSVWIQFNSIKELYSFIDIIDQYPGNYEIVSGPYVVSAKSLMSLLSLDLSRPFHLVITSDDSDEILRKIQPFISHE